MFTLIFVILLISGPSRNKTLLLGLFVVDCYSRCGSLNCFMFCCALLCVSSFWIVFMEKGELVALLGLSSWCLLIIVWLFLAVPWVCLQFVIVVFPDHTHLLFLSTM